MEEIKVNKMSWKTLQVEIKVIKKEIQKIDQDDDDGSIIDKPAFNVWEAGLTIQKSTKMGNQQGVLSSIKLNRFTNKTREIEKKVSVQIKKNSI